MNFYYTFVYCINNCSNYNVNVLVSNPAAAQLLTLDLIVKLSALQDVIFGRLGEYGVWVMLSNVTRDLRNEPRLKHRYFITSLVLFKMQLLITTRGPAYAKPRHTPGRGLVSSLV